MANLAVRLLRGLEIDGLDGPALGSRKARSLLWMLALARGAPVPGDAIVQTLWGDQPPASPADQLAVLVSRLRKVLGRERISRGDAGYRLHYDWLDVDELAALSGEAERRAADGNATGAAAAARVAMALLGPSYSAPELAGVWVDDALGELDRLVGRSRRVAASALLAVGAWLEAADVAGQSVTRDPYDEHALRLLMRANVAGGRTASALAAYAAARNRFVEELGTDPSPETEDLHAAILRGDPSGRSVGEPVVGTAQLTLVGRSLEFAQLDGAAGRAGAGAVQVVVVQGEAGIGKSALLRGWLARRPPGDVVLYGVCGELMRTTPLDPLFVPLAAHLRGLGPDVAREVLAADAPILAPLLGLSAASTLPSMLADGVIGPTLLFGALADVVGRLSPRGLAVVALDDAHRGGAALAEWVQAVRRRQMRLLVAATVRTPEPSPVAGDLVITLGPLDAEQTGQLVGAERAGSLFARSGGHPLFLTELALSEDADALPESLVEAVTSRCDALGRAGETLRSAAVIGMRVDPELLAAVLNRPAVELLDDAELGVRHQLLVDEAGTFGFRHSLVRAALATRVGAARTAWLHRQVARVLAGRAGTDPAEVADHARLGGDLERAASFLRAAATRAAERFDHATAEALLDESVLLHPDPAGWLDRARVRTRRGSYPAAYRDVARAHQLGAPALEVGAWASYFDRRFEQAVAYADDGAALADAAPVRARCLAVAGRTRHASGDLAAGERLLLEAVDLATGPDRMIAAAWLGVLRSHQSRPEAALTLLRPATRPDLPAEHTSAALHALLFAGHSHALAGRAADALAMFERHTLEVARRDVGRFEGRGTNFAGWVLRSLGAVEEAVDLHRAALETGQRLGTPELRIAAREDLAEAALGAGALDETAEGLAAAQAELQGDLVFGWRLQFKLDLLRARLTLAQGEPLAALQGAELLAARAAAVGVPRYAAAAQLVGYWSRAALGEAVELDAVAVVLSELRAAVAVESWWWTGETAAALQVPRWVDDAAAQVREVAAAAGVRGPGLVSHARPRLDTWRAAAGG